jgi:hypothetical protein
MGDRPRSVRAPSAQLGEIGETPTSPGDHRQQAGFRRKLNA